MRNKRSAMAVSALFILIFHLWINLFPANEAENFIKQASYLGVDMFFFLSGWSLALRPIEDHKAFLLSRFQAVYVKYVLLAVTAFLYSGWSVSRLLFVVAGVELFVKGGGAFLWFLPAILWFYVGWDLFSRYDRETSVWVVIVLWGIPALLLTWLTDYTQIFIVWNRIPIFLLGICFSRLLGANGGMGNDSWKQVLREVLLALAGLVLIWFFGYRERLQFPIADMFYVMVIPAAIGLALLASRIPEGKVIRAIGSSTLEMYGIQMIFGYRIANRILKLTGSKALTNLLAMSAVVLISVGVHYGYHFLEKKIRQGRKG